MATRIYLSICDKDRYELAEREYTGKDALINAFKEVAEDVRRWLQDTDITIIYQITVRRD